MKALTDIVKQHDPISRASLAKRLGIRERDVQALIAALNIAGVPVVSTGRGFIFARKNSEKQHFLRTIKAAARSMLQRAAGVEKRDLDIVAGELFAPQVPT